jgi:hypothetical protein
MRDSAAPSSGPHSPHLRTLDSNIDHLGLVLSLFVTDYFRGVLSGTRRAFPTDGNMVNITDKIKELVEPDLRYGGAVVLMVSQD